MIQYDFESHVGFWIGMTSHMWDETLRKALAPKGITFRHVEVLSSLILYGDLTQTELADKISIETSTLVRVLDRMETEGWIQRHPDPTDRRKNIIRVTEGVAPRWAEIVAEGDAIQERAVQGLTERQVAQLRKLLGVVRANLESEDSPDERRRSREQRS